MAEDSYPHPFDRLDSPDPWSTTTSSDYDPNEFYITASDDRGHSQQQRVNMPTGVSGELSALVQSGRYPYRTNADFIRDAIVHRLHWLEHNFQTTQHLREMLAVERRRHTFAQLKEAMEELRKEVEDIRTSIQEAGRTGDVYALRLAVGEAHLAVEEMREPYKSQVKEILNESRRQFRGLFPMD